MRWRRLGVFAAYPAVAGLALAPLVRHPWTRVAAGDGSGDSFLFLWNLWWVKVAVFERLTTPFDTNLLYWPQQTSLILHSMSSANGVLSAPLQAMFPGTAGLVFSLNVMTFLTFVLTGISAHLLAEASGARRPAALLAGLLSMLLPYRLWHLNHLDLLSMQWAFCCLLWLPRALAPGAWRARIILAIFAALTTFSDYEVAVYTVLSSMFMVLWRWLESRDMRHAIGMLRGIGASLAFALVLHVPLFLTLWRLGDPVRPAAGGQLYNANLAAFFLQGTSGPAHEAFLGGAFMLTLVVVATRVRHRTFWMWATLGTGFLVLSLGPTLRAGHWTLFQDLMPYAWLKSLLPFMDLSRAPVRMAGFGGVCLAIALGSAFPKRPATTPAAAPVTFIDGLRREWIVAALLVLLVAERWPWRPVATVEATVPAAYRVLASEAGEFAIRPLPESYYHRVVYMFWQTVHRKPMTSGYVSRPTDGVRASIAEWQNTPPAALQERLTANGVRYVLVHTDDHSRLLTSEPVVQPVEPRAGK